LGGQACLHCYFDRQARFPFIVVSFKSIIFFALRETGTKSDAYEINNYIADNRFFPTWRLCGIQKLHKLLIVIKYLEFIPDSWLLNPES